MREFGVGLSLPRVEDARLVQGRGRYTDDIKPDRSTRMYVLRSVYAFARLNAVNTAAAKASQGVLAVLTGQDAVDEGFGTFGSWVRRSGPDGEPNFEPPYRILAHEFVRFVGEPVAIVIAETLDQAKSAAELIEVDYAPLPSVPTLRDAMREGAPTVWEECPGNVNVQTEIGNRETVDAAFAKADRVVTLDQQISRVTAAPIEPRTAVGEWNAVEQRYQLHAALQSPHMTRSEIASRIFKISESQLRVVAPDVGGAFGMKGLPHPEVPLVLWAARVTERPVRWTADRSESFLGDHHARDNIVRSQLALDAQGKFLGLRVETNVNVGAYLSTTGVHCAVNNLGGICGVYNIPAVHAAIRCLFSNSSPTSAYRGAGRPEASMMIERLIDVAAAELGMDAAELRWRNLIQPSQMPHNTNFVFTYDCGDFPTSQQQVQEMCDWGNFEERRREAATRGKLRGLGMAHVIEIAAGLGDEMGELQIEASGDIIATVGTHSHGQGHETTFRQLISEFFGIEHSKIRIRYGDTDMLPFGIGTGSSRTAAVGAYLLQTLSERLIEKTKRFAAIALKAEVEDIEFRDGAFHVSGSNRNVPLPQVARLAHTPMQLPPGVEGGLSERALVRLPAPTFPNGCHVCELEIDRETGQVEIQGYWVVEDVGRAINPMIVKGQIQGGAAQGIGQALGEFVHYDEDGQLLTGSFMDYAMPRANEIPAVQARSNDVPTKTNPLGIKGAGECGLVGALPATMNAVCNALLPLGVRHVNMPATPARLWHAIQDAANKDAN